MVTSAYGAAGTVKTIGIEFPPKVQEAAVGTVHELAVLSTNTIKYGKAVYKAVVSTLVKVTQ
jgi:hypothetical protein